MDYTPRGARPDNHAGNPILCHIKCQGRSFRCRVITAETAGGDGGGGEGGGGVWWGGRGGAGGKEKMKVSEEVRGGWTESLRYLSTSADQLVGFCSRHVLG